MKTNAAQVNVPVVVCVVFVVFVVFVLLIVCVWVDRLLLRLLLLRV